MKYLNLPVSLGQDELIIKATHEQIGVWFLLQTYCHSQMNGGIIKGCHEWNDAMWLRIAGVRADLVAGDSPLWHWSSMVLVIHHYDTQAEDAYKRKQRMGKQYADRRWEAAHQKKVIRLSSGNSNSSQ